MKTKITYHVSTTWDDTIIQAAKVFKLRCGFNSCDMLYNRFVVEGYELNLFHNKGCKVDFFVFPGCPDCHWLIAESSPPIIATAIRFRSGGFGVVRGGFVSIPKSK